MWWAMEWCAHHVDLFLRPSECCFCPLQSCWRSVVFSHHLQDTDVWGFRERKTNLDHMLLAVGNIKSHVMRFSVTNQVAWLDLSFDAWLGSFYTSKHTVQACIIKKEHQSDPRPLKFCLWEKGTFVHTCWALRQSEPVTQALCNWEDLNRPLWWKPRQHKNKQKKSKWMPDCKSFARPFLQKSRNTTTRRQWPPFCK